MPTKYGLTFIADHLLHSTESYRPQMPWDYEPIECGCPTPPTPPELYPAPPPAPVEPEPGPPGGWVFWLIWASGGWILEPDPPWELPGGHFIPKHEIEPPEPAYPWEKLEPYEWLPPPK